MTWSFLPVSGGIWQKFRGYKPIEDYAERAVKFSPAEVLNLPETICLPGEINRVTGTHEMAHSLEDEIKQTLSPTLNNIESYAYLIRDAVIGHNRVSTFSSFQKLSCRSTQRKPVRISEELETAALCSSWQGNDYFAHFLLDDATTYTIAKEFAQPFFSGGSQPRTQHCLDYVSRFGLPYQEKNNIIVRNLWLFRDFPLGKNKRLRLNEMKSRLLSANSKESSNIGAYIRRGKSGQIRFLENEAEIEEWLISEGFIVIDPENQSVEEISTALHGVSVVIGVEGSQLVHALFNMAPQGTIICIQPADRFNAVYRNLCAAFDLRWGFVVAEGTTKSFCLQLDRLKSTLDLVLSSNQRNVLC